MSRYVSASGYSGQEQSVVWHYKTDIDRDLLNRWFIDIFEQGVLRYTPHAGSIGGATLTISKGTTLIIEEKTATVDGERKIAKLDMVADFDDIDVSGLGNDTYNLIASWDNASDDTRGVEFLLLNAADLNTQYTLTGYNYVQLGQVVVAGGVITDNNATNQTVGSMYSGLEGWSGWSGEVGESGYSGWSGDSGFSGESGASTSGWSGWSGEAGASGISGWSGEAFVGSSGYSGWSGEPSLATSGYSGPSGWSGAAGTQALFLGRSGYNSTTGRVITHNLGYTNYIMMVTSSSQTSGYLGEVYVIKAANTATVYNTGLDATSLFDYIGYSGS